MSHQYKVLLVGLGNIGFSYDLNLENKFIYSHARAFSKHSQFSLVAGIDPDPDKRNIFSYTYNCPAYIDIDSALCKHTPDLVTIAVPTEYHAKTVKQILGKFIPQAILCEKPIAYDLAQAQYIVDECARHSVNLYVNYMRRCDPGVVKVKSSIDSGAMGSNFKGIVWYSKGFLHNGSHFFNLLEYWLGDLKDSYVLNHGRNWNEIDPEPDVQVEFANGKVIFLSAWEEAFSHYTIELLSKNGRLRYEQGGKLIEWQPVTQDQILDSYMELADSREKIYSDMDRYQINVAEQLIHAMNGKDNSICSGIEALKTLTNMHKVLAGGKNEDR